MTREAEFREAVECACDDARLSLTEIGSILIDLGHKYLGSASGTEAQRATTVKQGVVHDGPVPERQTPITPCNQTTP